MTNTNKICVLFFKSAIAIAVLMGATHYAEVWQKARTPDWKIGTRVTLKVSGFCSGYLSSAIKEDAVWVYKVEDQRCFGKQERLPTDVVSTEIKESLPLVTQEKWEKIRASGPKYKAGSLVRVPGYPCIYLTAYPYLDNDGIWLYPMAKREKCTNTDISFPMLVPEAKLTIARLN